MLDPLVRLRKAVRDGNLGITRKILQRFPELWLNIDSGNKGWSNLHLASYYGNYLICFHLISFRNKYSKSLNQTNSVVDLITFDGLSVLHLAVMNQHSQTLLYLLQEFPGKLWLDFRGGDEEQTPLHYCCIHGFREGIKLLVEFGADWNMKDKGGNTCLHLCFQYGNFECIQDLLKVILVVNKNEGDGMKMIDKFEAVRNGQGSLPIDVAFSFDLVEQYKFLKQELYAFNQGLSNATGSLYSQANISSSSLTLGKLPQVPQTESKVLSSPVVAVSLQNQAMNQIQQQQQQQSQSSQQQPLRHNNSFDGTTSTTPKTGKSRAYSLSIPGPNILADPNGPNGPNGGSGGKSKANATRKRSNTLYNMGQTNSLGAAVTRVPSAGPHKPIASLSVLHRTPSLKSVTISPLLRNSGNENGASPHSSASITSLSSTPPTHQANRKKSFSNIAMTPQTKLQFAEDSKFSSVSSGIKSGEMDSPFMHHDSNQSSYTNTSRHNSTPESPKGSKRTSSTCTSSPLSNKSKESPKMSPKLSSVSKASPKASPKGSPKISQSAPKTTPKTTPQATPNATPTATVSDVKFLSKKLGPTPSKKASGTIKKSGSTSSFFKNNKAENDALKRSKLSSIKISRVR